MWIDDADAQEAEAITAQFRTVDQSNSEREFNCLAGDDLEGLLAGGYPGRCATSVGQNTLCVGGFKAGCECLADSDCEGGCRCASACCRCSVPLVCPAQAGGSAVVAAGQMTVELRSEYGLLSLVPPPGGV